MKTLFEISSIVLIVALLWGLMYFTVTRNMLPESGCPVLEPPTDMMFTPTEGEPMAILYWMYSGFSQVYKSKLEGRESIKDDDHYTEADYQTWLKL